jgi:hypothetical protein
MHTFDLRAAQEKSHWVAFAISLLILVSTISFTVVFSSPGQAFNANVAINLLPFSGNYSSPQRCRECHAAEFQAWSHTTHAEASFDPIFQVSLQRVAEPGECFACHTTGYDSATGQFVLSGVTCEACHGPYRPEHPEESMVVAASEDLCGMCHTGTLAEWRSSRHGKVGVTCVDCHEVHTQKTHAAENTNTLCSGCHQIQTPNATHFTHSRADLYCVDCHLARVSDDVNEMVKGQAVTGHTFTVSATTCNDCHSISVPSDADSP